MKMSEIERHLSEIERHLPMASWERSQDPKLAERGARGYFGISNGWRFVVADFGLEEQGLPPGSRGYDGTAVLGGLVIRLPRDLAERAFRLAEVAMKDEVTPLSEDLRASRVSSSTARMVVNTYMQMKAYGGDRIAICYQPWGDGRTLTTAGWHVVRLVDGREIKTDPTGHWSDYGQKFFGVELGSDSHHKRKKAALDEAIAWANERYGKREFVRNRLGDFVEAEVNKAFPIRRTRDET